VGYQKYDKEEAQRVYEQAKARHEAQSDVDKVAFNYAALFIGALMLLVVVAIIIINVVDQPKTYTVTTIENVVVTKYRLSGGKSTVFIVEYYTVIGAEHGEFETKEISFSVGDTIQANVIRTKEIYEDQVD